MGNQAVILVAGTLLLVSIFVIGLMRTGNDLTENAVDTYSEAVAKEINNSAIEIAMSTLADSNEWRSSLSNLQLSGGSSTVTFKDTVVGTDTAVVVRSRTEYVSGIDKAIAKTEVIVMPAEGFIPPVVKGAFTAFGPIDDAISDMIIDGRNWNWNLTLSPKSGTYAVSTGAPVFVNTQDAEIGGTTYTTSPATDIVPSFPEDPLVIETNASWPDGWPTTPDAALGYPEGTLKNIAIKKLVPGSQYVTAWTQLRFPLRGVTYMEVPNGTEVRNKKIFKNPEGILVLHSPATDALWSDISTVDGSPFKGLMLFDNLFHIHMDILGGVAILTPNTIQNNCNGNKAHWIRYSTEVLQAVTKGSRQEVSASWKSRLKVLSWYE